MILASSEDVLKWRADRPEGITMTNGCFDILHIGHLQMLEFASKLCGHLLVCINSDESVRQLKGPSRPINSDVDRATLVGALWCVDAVHIFKETRVINAIRLARPTFYVKAGDYTLETLDPGERAALEECGAKILFAPFIRGYSTTKIIQEAKGGS